MKNVNLKGDTFKVINPPHALIKLDYEVYGKPKEYVDFCESLLVANRESYDPTTRVSILLHGEKDVMPRELYNNRPFVNRLLCKKFPKVLQHETKMGIAAGINSLGMVYKALQYIDDWNAEEINNFAALRCGGAIMRRGRSRLGMERRVAASLLFEYLHVPYSDEIFNSAIECGERTGLFNEGNTFRDWRTFKSERFPASKDRIFTLMNKSPYFRNKCFIFATTKETRYSL